MTEAEMRYVEALEAKLAKVRELLAELEDPNPEPDQDWQEDPVTCIRDTLRAILTYEEPLRSDPLHNGEDA